MKKVLVTLGIAIGLVLVFSSLVAEAEAQTPLELVAPAVEEIAADVQLPFEFVVAPPMDGCVPGKPCILNSQCGDGTCPYPACKCDCRIILVDIDDV